MNSYNWSKYGVTEIECRKERTVDFSRSRSVKDYAAYKIKENFMNNFVSKYEAILNDILYAFRFSDSELLKRKFVFDIEKKEAKQLVTGLTVLGYHVVGKYSEMNGKFYAFICVADAEKPDSVVRKERQQTRTVVRRSDDSFVEGLIIGGLFF